MNQRRLGWGARVRVALAVLTVAANFVASHSSAQLIGSARPDIVGTFGPNTGSVIISVDGTSSPAQVAGGRIALSAVDATCVPAPGHPCVYTLAALQVAVTPFTIKGVTIADFQIDNWAPVYDVADSDGSGFVVPPNTPFMGGFTEAGSRVAVNMSNDPTPLTVVVDPVHNRLVITGDFAGTIDGSAVEATVMVSALQPLTNRPPVADAGPSLHLFTGSDGFATIPFDASRTVDPNGDLSWSYFRDVRTGFRYSSSSAALRERFGNYQFELVAGDQQGGEDTAPFSVAVSCLVLPQISSAGLGAIQSCSSSAATVNLPLPSVVAACSPGSFQLTGQVVALDNLSLSTPIPVVSGSVSVAPGPITVRWTAVDLAGNSATLDEPFDVVVPPGLIATHSFMVSSGAGITNELGGGATIVNTGSGMTELGAGAHSGSILSQGSVQLDSHSQVSGFVRTAGGITQQDNVTVNGGQYSHGAVSFLPVPSFNATLAAGSQNISLEPGTSASRGPGGYADVTIKSSATLTLSPGVYAFNSFDMEPSATVALSGTGPISISVNGTVILRGQFTGTSVESRLALLALGTNAVAVDAPFAGTLAVPNGQLQFSTVQGTDRGRFLARDVLVQANQTVAVHPFNCP